MTSPEGEHPPLVRFPGRFEGVKRFARLADCNDDGAFLDDWIPVTELAGELDLRGNLREILEDVLAHHRRMQGCPLPEEYDPLGLQELLGVVGDPAENDPPSLDVDATLETTTNRIGLFMNLLEHVVLVLAELDLLEVDFQLHQLGRHRYVLDRGCPEGIPGQADNGFILEFDRLVRVGDDRAGIRRDDVLGVSDPDHQGRTLAGRDEHARLLATHHRDGIGTRHLAKGCLDRGLEVPGIQFADEVRKHLRIGLRREDVPLLLEIGLQRSIVLDDPVVDQDDAMTIGLVIAMRVSIQVIGLTVRRPSRMCNADLAVQATTGLDVFLEHEYPTGRLDNPEFIVLTEDRDASRVISPVLEALEPLQQDRDCLGLADVGDDSTHVACPRKAAGRPSCFAQRGDIRLDPQANCTPRGR